MKALGRTAGCLASVLVLTTIIGLTAQAKAGSMQVAETRQARPTAKHDEPKPETGEPAAKRQAPERTIPGSAIERRRPVPGEAAGNDSSSASTRPARESARLSSEEWKAERERLRAIIAERMEIKSAASVDDINIAAFKDDSNTFMFFRKRDAFLDIEAISTRDFARGAGSVFASEALRKTGATPEKVIRLRNLIQPDTVHELAAGTPPAETKMGKFGTAVAEDLGRKVQKVTVEDQISDFGNRTNKKDMIITLE